MKYYTVYGGGKAKEPVYSYGFSQQDCEKKQMKLDFDHILNMGNCDVVREVNLTRNRTIKLPYTKLLGIIRRVQLQYHVVRDFVCVEWTCMKRGQLQNTSSTASTPAPDLGCPTLFRCL